MGDSLSHLDDLLVILISLQVSLPDLVAIISQFRSPIR